MRQARRDPSYQRYLLQRIEASRQALAPAARMGIALVAEDGTLLLQRQADELFVPASTAKVLVGTAALKALGPAYRFVTELCALPGARAGAPVDLFLHTVGDPSLSGADLVAMAQMARAQGIEQVGSVWIDDTDFDAVPYGPGWMWDDLSEGYSAPISATLVSENALHLTILPGRREGDALRIVQSPNEFSIPIVNQARTVGMRGPSNVRVGFGAHGTRSSAPSVSPAGPVPQPDEPPAWALSPNQQVTIAGSLPIEGMPRVRRLALGQPSEWTAALVRRLLQDAGVQVTGGAKRAQTPDGCLPLVRHSSAPLGTLMPVWMKASDNLAFEALGKRLGQVMTQKPGSFLSASQTTRQVLAERLGLMAPAMRLVDSSGTSRYNLVTPQMLARVLVAAMRDFEIGFEMIGSLPLAGVDGTLSRRLPTHRGRLRAKTGTMTGISSLAGIVQTDDGERLGFAIMLEGTTASSERLRMLQDHIVALVSDVATVPLGEPREPL